MDKEGQIRCTHHAKYLHMIYSTTIFSSSYKIIDALIHKNKSRYTMMMMMIEMIIICFQVKKNMLLL